MQVVFRADLEKLDLTVAMHVCAFKACLQPQGTNDINATAQVKASALYISRIVP